MNLYECEQDYLIFAAKKSGAKCDDLPSIDPEQTAKKTNIRKFFLQENPKKVEIRKNSNKSIATEIDC